VAGEPHDAVVKLDTYRNLQRHRTVLPAIARLSCPKCSSVTAMIMQLGVPIALTLLCIAVDCVAVLTLLLVVQRFADTKQYNVKICNARNVCQLTEAEARIHRMCDVFFLAFCLSVCVCIK